jgi:tetratricopeptide (TPR) repeat protein
VATRKTAKKASAKAAKKAAKTVTAATARPAAKAAAKPAAKPKPAPKAAAAPARTAPSAVGSSAERRQAELYARAVEAFQAGKFKRAVDQFEEVAQGPDASLRHRAQVHIRICRQRTESDTVELASVEDYYNYAVKLINDRRLDEAEKHLDQALKKAAGAAHIHYAKAIVAALRKNGDNAYRSLTRAIELDPRNRLLARRDPDLAGVRDEARIVALLQGDGSGAD